MIESICQQSDSHANMGSGMGNYHWSCCALRTTLISVLACEKEHVIKTTPSSKSKKKERNRAKKPSSNDKSPKKEPEELKPDGEKVVDQSSSTLLSNDKEKAEVRLDDKSQEFEEESSEGVSDQPEPAATSTTFIDAEMEAAPASTNSVSFPEEHVASLDTLNEDTADPTQATTVTREAEGTASVTGESTTIALEEVPKSLGSSGSDAGESSPTLSESTSTLEPSEPFTLPSEPKANLAKEHAEAADKTTPLPVIDDSQEHKEDAIPSASKESVKDSSLEDLKGSAKQKPRVLVRQRRRYFIHVPDSVLAAVAEKGKPHIAYSSYIISNSTDHRLEGRVAFPAEMQLQVMSQQVYETLLKAVQYATPQSFETSEDLSQPSSASKGMKDGKGSLCLLLPALERAFLGAINQQGSTVSVLSLLQFWTEVGHVTLTMIKKKWLAVLLHSSLVVPISTGNSEKLPLKLKLVSPRALSLLLDKLQVSSMQDVRLWQLSILLLHLHSKFCKKAYEDMTVDVDKLYAVLMRYCTSQESESEQQCQESNQELTFSKLLTGIASLHLRGESDGAESRVSGAHFLLNMLVMTIEARYVHVLGVCVPILSE